MKFHCACSRGLKDATAEDKPMPKKILFLKFRRLNKIKSFQSCNNSRGLLKRVLDIKLRKKVTQGHV